MTEVYTTTQSIMKTLRSALKRFSVKSLFWVVIFCLLLTGCYDKKGQKSNGFTLQLCDYNKYLTEFQCRLYAFELQYPEMSKKNYYTFEPMCRDKNFPNYSKLSEM